MNVIELAIDIALKSHRGQVDKAGKPYILHPLRLMEKMETDEEKVVAVLHDVLEDSTLTASELMKLGVPDHAVQAIACLTKQLGEKYDDYLNKVLSNTLAVKVKRADLEDNMNILRLNAITDNDLSRLQQYHRAWKMLSGQSDY
ncbi:hypothetical protein [uncultured Shewanella sp.]|uniref:hypothetical protein n=1 Tax=uncultured Shewanella sp. TaxID=173975 RepID=UPI00260B5817|nr:hypothetical protein [uncultured Shewanella sp.]